jgi:outer membrane immunogenic protein
MNRLAMCVAAIAALIAAPAFAADMAVKAPPPLPEPVYSWTGFYFGLNAGWSWGKQDTTVNFPGSPQVTSFTVVFAGGGTLSGSCATCPTAPIAFQESTRLNGAIGGVQGGYNWQAASNWILGVEADFQASGENADGNTHQNANRFGDFTLGLPGGGTVSGAFITSQSISHNDSLLWFGTVRGRVGYAIWPTVMVYGTGGLAYGRLNESVSASFNFAIPVSGAASTGTATLVGGAVVPLPFSVSQGFEAAVTKTGWTVGGGIEGAVPNTHVTWKVEYLYMDLGSESYTFNSSGLGTITVNTHFNDNIARVGLNYQFH